MSTSDLSAVAARRAEIVSFIGGHDAKVATLQAELEELAVTERVLHRLERLMPEEPAEYVTEYATNEPIAQRAVSAVKTLLGETKQLVTIRRRHAAYAGGRVFARAVHLARACDWPRGCCGYLCGMSKPDLEAVIARRMAVQNELTAL